MNTELRKKAQNYFQKDCFKLMNKAFFGKVMGNVRKYKNIKLLITNARKNYLMLKQNYHTTNFFQKIKQQHKHS